ncbi:MAG: DUF1203 domain-containing protein [Ilumatobacteraceae bacterium]
MTDITFSGIDPSHLREVLATGQDCNGVTIQPFIDEEGGWPMRCCLADSLPGEEVAIIAWSPYAWNGPYRETGPIVVHTGGCPGTWQQPTLPDEFDRRRMTLRPYDADHRILYDLVSAVPEGGSLTALSAALLERPEVAEVYGRNISGGCFAFVARRAG